MLSCRVECANTYSCSCQAVHEQLQNNKTIERRGFKKIKHVCSSIVSQSNMTDTREFDFWQWYFLLWPDAPKEELTSLGTGNLCDSPQKPKRARLDHEQSTQPLENSYLGSIHVIRVFNERIKTCPLLVCESPTRLRTHHYHLIAGPYCVIGS